MPLFSKKQSEQPRRRQASGVVREPAARDDSSTIFRRNRTLTGTTSSVIDSSQTGTKAHLQSPRTHVHHLTIKRRKLGVLLLGSLGGVIVTFLLVTQLTAQVSIRLTAPAQASAVDTERYEKAIQEYLGQNPLARLRFVLDTDSLVRTLAAELPEVAAVHQKATGQIGETEFELTMRTPTAGWTIQSTQYYVDASGVAFGRNFFSTPGVQIIDNSGASLEPGVAVASNRLLSFVGRVVALSKERGVIVIQAILPQGTTRQLELKLAGSSTTIRLSIDRPVGEQVEDMARALTYFTQKGQAPAIIDIRVSNKAYYQ